MYDSHEPSLSKGVFVLKPERISPRKKRKTTGSVDVWINRRKCFLKAWSDFEIELENLCDKTIEEEKAFVLNYVKSVQFEKTLHAMQTIPTIVLIMGVNIPDHSKIFLKISEELFKEEIFSVSVQSNDCTSVPLMIQKIVTSVIESYDGEQNIKKHNCTFQSLASWYNSKQLFKSSGKKSNYKNTQKLKLDKIVIILEDVESFSSSVLENFILICSGYVDSLPLILVFGVSTAMWSVHSLISQKATAHLSMTVFTPPTASSCLSQILLMLLKNPALPFRISPDVFQLLTDNVIYNDFTISSLTHFLKFCVWDHYYSKPSSVFANKDEEVNIMDLKHFESLPSYQKHVLNLKSDEKSEQIKTDMVNKLISELGIYFKSLMVLLECLSDMTSDLPGNPMGKQVKDMYMLLNKPLIKSENYEKALKLLSLQTPDTLKQKLIYVANRIANYQDFPGFDQYLADLEGLCKDADNLQNGPVVNEKTKLRVDVKFQKGIKVAELKEKLKEISSQKPLSSLEKWKKNFVTVMNTIFNVQLPIDVPLQEIMMYNSLSNVKNCLLPTPKSTIHQALLNPYVYLQCECCKLSSVEEIRDSMPYLSISYKIHLEHNRVVNIQDWLQTFVGITTLQLPTKMGKKKAQEIKLQQANFFQALSELHLLGIVKTPKRKFDSVVRLTWGPC